MMMAKKMTIDTMIKNGYQLEYPYFWYLENLSLETLQEMLHSLLTK